MHCIFQRELKLLALLLLCILVVLSQFEFWRSENHLMMNWNWDEHPAVD